MESDVLIDGSCTAEKNETGSCDKSTVEKIRKRRSSIFHSRTIGLFNGSEFRERRGSDYPARSEETVANPPVDPADTVIPIENNLFEQEIEAHFSLLTSPSESLLDESEPFDLEAYIEKLREERQQWQSKLKERKNKRRHLTREKATDRVEPYDIQLKIMSKKERAFLLARPKYEHLADQVNKLSQEALTVANLNELVCELNKQFILQMRQVLLRNTKKIIEIDRMSTAL